MTAAGLTRSRYELLKKLSIPTLIIHGTSDPVIPIAHADKLLQLIPNAERLWIIDAGHQFPFPNMSEIQSKMIDWINDLLAFAKTRLVLVKANRSLLKSIREFIVANPRNKIKPQPEPAAPVPIFFGNYPEAFDKSDGVFAGNAPA